MKTQWCWLLVVAGCGFAGSEGTPLIDGRPNDAGMVRTDARVDAPSMPPPAIRFLPMNEVRFSTANWTLAESLSLDTSLLSSSSPLPAGVTFTEGTQSDGSSIAVLRANHLIIDTESTLRITGARPIFVLAKEVTILGSLDAGAKRHIPGPGGGAGMGIGAGQSSREENNGPIRGHSGAGGGSFGTAGGNGGTVGDEAGSAGTIYEINGRFVGGAAGGRSGSCGSSRGAGGGAIFIYAETSIRIMGSINASGGGGAEGLLSCFGSSVRAGGGGGSGGTIWLHTATISGSGIVAANGGGGGASASSTAADGEPGEDGQALLVAAKGGIRATSIAGATNGGDGAALNINATAGTSVDVSGSAGGGGGGSGRIFYRVPAGLGEVRASPAAARDP